MSSQAKTGKQSRSAPVSKRRPRARRIIDREYIEGETVDEIDAINDRPDIADKTKRPLRRLSGRKKRRSP